MKFLLVALSLHGFVQAQVLKQNGVSGGSPSFSSVSASTVTISRTLTLDGTGAKMTVLGTSGAASQSANETIKIEGTSTAVLRIGTDSGGSFGTWFQSNASYPILLNPLAGSVGVGTAAPEAANKLQVQAATGNVVIASSTTASGFGVFSAHGSSGGCIMLTDTDNAGWTKCKALNGTLSCETDSDGICD